VPGRLTPLLAADELLHHQITETFGRVSQSDRSWTEKVCAMACSRDGRAQLALGLGQYVNRNVMDAYAGLSRGVEQWTVRASRALAPDLSTTSVGPIHYEVIDPLRTVRFALDPNDETPLSFEWFFEGAVPPALEDREVHTSRDGHRIDADVVRFHHVGRARGWFEIDGERHEFDDGSWVSTRDRSWGVRYMVGAPIDDVEPPPAPTEYAGYTIWFPALWTAAEGTTYASHLYYQSHAFGPWQRVSMQGGFEYADGRREPFTAVIPDLTFDDENRRLRGGTIRVVARNGTERVLTVEPQGDTGFHLGAGLYFGLDDRWHGQWRGPLHVEGEYVEDCSQPSAAHRLHQIRDCVVALRDEDGNRGVGNLQSIVTGAHPDMGLTAGASFT
jgi:hypothetical protein